MDIPSQPIPGKSTTRPLTAPGTSPLNTQPIPPAHRGVLGTVGDVFVGGGEAIADIGKGLYTMIRHPIQTLKGIGYLITKLVTDPKEGFSILGHAFIDPYMRAVKEGHPGKAIGRGIVEVGSLFITPGDVASVAKATVTGATGAFNALRTGAGVSGAVKAAEMSVDLSGKAAHLAEEAAELSKLGYVDEAAKMAQYARVTQHVGTIAEAGNVTRAANLAQMLANIQHVRVGAQFMSLPSLVERSTSLLKAGSLATIAADVIGNDVDANVRLESSMRLNSRAPVRAARAIATSGERAADVLAELPATERMLQLAGKVAVKSPYVLLSPATALSMGRINEALPSLGQLGQLTPEKAQAIASQYHLAPGADNAKQFLAEVSTYDTMAVGPTCGTPEQVRQLQAALRVAGYDVSPSGTYDDATALAVMHFKREHGIHQSYRQQDGTYAVNEYLDQQTATKLYDQIQAVDGQAAGPASKTPLDEASKAIAQQHNLLPESDNVAAFQKEIATYGQAVGPDSAQSDIGRIQSVLLRLGYPVKATGAFDDATATAIIAFKQQAGIHQDYRLANGDFAINEYVDPTTELRMRAALQAKTR